jgi:hypothetical protein
MAIPTSPKFGGLGPTRSATGFTKHRNRAERVSVMQMARIRSVTKMLRRTAAREIVEERRIARACNLYFVELSTVGLRQI